jgi:transposase InsO family protein
MIQAFKYLQNELCVSVRGVLAVGAEALFVKKQLCLNRSGKIKAWKHFADPADKRVKWIIVGSLTEIYKARLEWFYGSDLHLVAKRENLRAAAIERMVQAEFTYFVEARSESNMALFSLEDAVQLQEACGWLRLAGDQKAMNTLGWSKKTVWYDDLALVLSTLNLKGLAVSHGAVLKRKSDLFHKEGAKSLIHGNANNEAARKVTDLGVERIMQLASSPNKPGAMEIAAIYNREVAKHGGAVLSVERVRQIMAENAHSWFALRHGNVEADRALGAHLKRKRASRPDALWYIDGTALQYVYVDDQGKPRSDLYIQYVTDAHTDAVVGYAIGHTETSDLVLAALRAAVRMAGTLPEQAIYDQGPANKSAVVQSALNKLCRLHHAAAAYNAKAKRVESVTGRIEQQVMRQFGNFKGGNVTTKNPDSKANAEHLRTLIKDGGLPTLKMLLEQVRITMEIWNGTQERGQIYATAALDVRRKADKALVIAALWQARPDTCTYMAHGLKVQIQGVRYEYAVHAELGIEDMAWRERHLGDTFKLMCDPTDSEHREMALIDVHTGALVAIAERKYEYAEAWIDRPDGEMPQLIKALNVRKDGLKGHRTAQEQRNERLKELDFEVYDHRLLNKDRLNVLEQVIKDKELGIDTGAGLLAPLSEMPERRGASHVLYGGEEASLELLD